MNENDEQKVSHSPPHRCCFKPSCKTTYDYVFIGGGTAACIAARKLYEKGASVCILEAGDYYRSDARLPVIKTNYAWTENIKNPNWSGLKTNPLMWENTAFPEKVLYGGGKCVGGGSTVNSAQWIQPSKNLINTNGLIPYLNGKSPVQRLALVRDVFKKIENYRDTRDGCVPAVDRGKHGRLFVTREGATPSQLRMYRIYTLGVNEWMKDSKTSVKNNGDIYWTGSEFRKIGGSGSKNWKYADMNEEIDYNTWEGTTCDRYFDYGSFAGPYQSTVKNGSRQSAAIAYLNDIVDKDGDSCNGRIKVISGALVTKIRFKNSYMNEVVAVEYCNNGESWFVGVNKRAILAAGINDAQILMQSGIGKAEDLTHVGIVRRPDGNVGWDTIGKNIQNHMVFTILLSAKTKKPTRNPPIVDASWGGFFPHPVFSSAEFQNGVRAFQIIGGINANGILRLTAVAYQTQVDKKESKTELTTPNPIRNARISLGYDEKKLIEKVSEIYRTVWGFGMKIINNTSSSYKFDFLSDYPNPTKSSFNSEFKDWYTDNVGQAFHYTNQISSAVDANFGIKGTSKLSAISNSIVGSLPDCGTMSIAYLLGYLGAKKIADLDGFA